jgi:flagellar biosynthesis protein FliR
MLLPFVASFTLILIRVGAAFMLIPMLGGAMIPGRVRIGLAAVVSILLTTLSGPVETQGVIELALAGTGEFALGLAIGLVVRLTLVAAEIAGGVAGLQMGFSFSRVADPMTNESSTVIANIMRMLGLFIILALDGHHMILGALAQSLNTAPPGAVLPRAAYAATAFPLLSSVMTTGVRMAAPVVVALLLTNASIGLLARAAPQLNLLIMGFAMAILVGMWMLAHTVWPGFSLFVQRVQSIPQLLQAVVGA